MSCIVSRVANARRLSSGEDSSIEVSEELLRDAKVEASELIERFSAQCTNMHLAFQHSVELTRGDIDEMFRTLHSLKGLARMVNIGVGEALLHKVEDYVDAVRNEKCSFTAKDVEHFSDLEHVLEQIFSEFPAISGDVASAAEKLGQAFLTNLATGQGQASSNAGGVVASSTQAAASGGAECATEAQERELLSKYIARSEKLYAIVFGPGVYQDAGSIASSEIASNIVTIGESILMRVLPEGALIVFAADLDLSMLSALFGETVIELEKSTSCTASLPAPWNALMWTSESKAASATPIAAEPAAVPASSEAALETTSHASAHSVPSEDDDFDSKNLAAGAAQNDLDPELLQDFISNADELLEQLGTSMLELESNPTSKDAIEAIFRNAHTIKGTAGMFGFRAIEKLTHVMENLFDRIRKGQLSVTPHLMDGLLYGLDRVRQMFENIKKGASSEVAINDAIAKLRTGSSPQANVAPVAPKQALAAAPAVEAQKAVEAPASSPPPSKPVEAKAAAGDSKADAAKAVEGAGTIRVDLKRLDGLVNLVGELVIDRTRFARIEEELRNKAGNNEMSHQMSESVLLFGRHMNEVQNIIMKIRMVPVGTVFNKFSRVVRDISRQCGKEIDLQIEGGETELDKTLVEEISDPLIHLIRNSVDHGIETPDVRETNGKSRRGTIRLRAYQDGNMIVISVQDDGKGLQVDKLRAKALQNGLVKETDHLSDKEVFNLIFEPGFSTAEKITNISGRGVGMDVVKKNIVKLKGFIELDSKLGEGTTTTIKLPLTLAIIPSLMVEAQGESYAIPLANVIESIRITPEDIQHIGSADFVKLRDRVLPILRLRDVFDLGQMEERLWYRVPQDGTSAQDHRTVRSSEGGPAGAASATPTLGSTIRSKRERKPRLIFVVVSVGEKRVGLIVDQLLGQQEIVVKSLGKLSSKQRGVAGGCVLGNGCVALVLDVGEIIEDFSQSKAGYANRAVS